ncbi:uncharacterized protein LOC123517168 [Portunus trituberculatus]|uniref:uncharacterized protein LOC123517168 n=1 Tax=Portunus trituberculatus TaxID=210409 RepID=UPI001E1CBE0D|nr:uncharacterized protein LOC123517168 [Portunus trituberculatus]
MKSVIQTEATDGDKNCEEIRTSSETYAGTVESCIPTWSVGVYVLVGLEHLKQQTPPSISSIHTKPSLYKKSFTSDGFATSSQESSPKVPRKLQEKHLFNKSTSSGGPHDEASSSGSTDPGPKRPADGTLRTILA